MDELQVTLLVDETDETHICDQVEMVPATVLAMIIIIEKVETLTSVIEVTDEMVE